MSQYAMENYMRTIRNGHEHVIQALPKLLSVWFSLSALPDLVSSATATKNHLGKVLAHICGRIAQAKQDIPASTWYLALPQLISRISHAHPETSKLIADIVVKVMWKHPHQVKVACMTHVLHTMTTFSAVL